MDVNNGYNSGNCKETTTTFGGKNNSTYSAAKQFKAHLNIKHMGILP